MLFSFTVFYPRIFSRNIYSPPCLVRHMSGFLVLKNNDADADYSAQDSWDEGFLRELVGKLKRKGKEGAPWRDNEERCRKYHEHDRWAPMCEGVTVVKQE